MNNFHNSEMGIHLIIHQNRQATLLSFDYFEVPMDFKTYRQKLNKVIDRHKEILFTNEKGEPHYWLDNDRIPKAKAFGMLQDILDEFKNTNSELFYAISDNFYQENCIFIDVADDGIGKLCNFWGYGIDPRLGKCRRYFVFSDCVNHWPKSTILKMNYQRKSIDEIKTIVDELERENILATKGNRRNMEYELIIASIGYDEGVIQDMEDLGLLDN